MKPKGTQKVFYLRPMYNERLRRLGKIVLVLETLLHISQEHQMESRPGISRSPLSGILGGHPRYPRKVGGSVLKEVDYSWQ